MENITRQLISNDSELEPETPQTIFSRAAEIVGCQMSMEYAGTLDGVLGQETAGALLRASELVKSGQYTLDDLFAEQEGAQKEAFKVVFGRLVEDCKLDAYKVVGVKVPEVNDAEIKKQRLKKSRFLWRLGHLAHRQS